MPRRLQRKITVWFLAAFLLSGSLAHAQAYPGKSEFIINQQTEELQPPPLGYSLFCMNPEHLKQCSVQRGFVAADANGKVVLTRDLLIELKTIKRSVFNTFRQASDRGIDDWKLLENSPRKKSGDCEDFVLTTRKELMLRGWPSESLLIATGSVRTNRGYEMHAVLVVRTTGGDLVLDNRTSAPIGIAKYKINWLTIQSPQNPMRFINVIPRP